MRNYGPDRPCSKCGRVSPDVEFHFRSNGRRNSACRTCLNKTDAPRRNYGEDRPCSKCGRKSPEVAFSSRKDGKRMSHCKSCNSQKQRDKVEQLKLQPDEYAAFRQRERASYKKHMELHGEHARELIRLRRFKYRYGLTPEQMSTLHKKQNGVCGICREPVTNPAVSGSNGVHVDHCHLTDKVRGLLCENCNFMLGHSKDNPGSLLRAAAYLRRKGYSAI